LVPVYRGKKGKDAQQDTDWLRHIFGLPYLKEEDVGPSFVEDFMSTIPVNEKFHKFADYLVENYIDEESVFPPKIWASFSEEIVTNNALESFHSHFKTNFYSPHPDIFTFCKQLVNVQSSTYIKINSVEESVRNHDKKYRLSQNILLEARDQYSSGLISRRDFLKKVSGRYEQR
jgi:hypothetical protein